MNRTKIEWVKNPDGSQGYTWNPITGCLNHKDGLCKGGGFPCYAHRLANGRLKQRYLNNQILPVGQFDDEFWADKPLSNPFYPRFWEERLHDRGLFQKEPRGIFPCDMSDLFGIGIPKAWTDKVIDQVKVHRQHRFYLLTKQSQNLPTSPSYFPDNCWVGVTVTANGFAPEAFYHLSMVEASVRFISFEPLIGQIGMDELRNLACVSDWWIIGAQTKPYKPPRIEWVREIVEAADRAGIPVFLKNNLKPLWEDDLFYPEWAQNKGDFGLRQEMPVKIASGQNPYTVRIE